MSDSLRPAVVIGEVLCDLYSAIAGVPLEHAESLAAHLGGAPANVAVQLALQGLSVELISAIGPDPTGKRILHMLSAHGVGTGHIEQLPGYRTGLTFIEVDPSGQRTFFPRRERSADVLLRAENLPEALIANACVLHHGTVTMRQQPALDATRRAVAIANEAGALVSVDINLRYKMYSDRETLFERAREAIAAANVVKAAREEAVALVGDGSASDLCQRLLELGSDLVMLTDGDQPFHLATRERTIELHPPVVAVVDTTGAGDAFAGAALARLCSWQVKPSALQRLSAEQLAELGRDAAEAGARATTALGAVGAFR